MENDEELNNLIDVYREHWGPRALHLFESAARSGQLSIFARCRSADPADLELSLVVRAMDPLTGAITEIKIGELSAPSHYVRPSDDAQPAAVPAPAVLH